MFVRNGHEYGLNRREPHRKSSGMVLYKHSQEPFYRTENHPVQHYGPMFLTICAYVIEIKSFRKGEITLDSSTLPLSVQGVFQLKVNFGAVKGAIPLVNLIHHMVHIEGIL